jgi:hypothetical protein
MIVSGAPTLKWSQKLISTPEAAAFCTTIRLAIEPSTVKLPARVEAIAITSHALSWSGRVATKGFYHQYHRHIADEIRQHCRHGTEHRNLIKAKPAYASDDFGGEERMLRARHDD